MAGVLTRLCLYMSTHHFMKRDWPNILDRKQALFSLVFNNHLNTRPFNNRTQIYHLNTGIVQFGIQMVTVLDNSAFSPAFATSIVFVSAVKLNGILLLLLLQPRPEIGIREFRISSGIRTSATCDDSRADHFRFMFFHVYCRFRWDILKITIQEKFVTKCAEQWGIKDYINMQTKNLVSNRDASKIGKISVFKFPNDFGIKN